MHKVDEYAVPRKRENVGICMGMQGQGLLASILVQAMTAVPLALPHRQIRTI
jgi:hypothetical protein